MSNIVRTKIYKEEKKAFKSFMVAAGFADFSLVGQKTGLYLNIEFTTPESVFNYRLRGIEGAYMATRSSTYFYDLDHDWDDEAKDFFGDEDDR